MYTKVELDILLDFECCPLCSWQPRLVECKDQLAVHYETKCKCDRSIDMCSTLEEVERAWITRCNVLKDLVRAIHIPFYEQQAVRDAKAIHDLRVALNRVIAENLAIESRCKPYEGEILIKYPTIFDTLEQSDEYQLEIHCYLIGLGKHYSAVGKTIAEAATLLIGDIDRWKRTGEWKSSDTLAVDSTSAHLRAVRRQLHLSNLRGSSEIDVKDVLGDDDLLKGGS